ncbi:MAG: bifunctional DNA primase/polymerase, partial [Nitrososphaera sp.]|nr:bifunctional DNA primase/polymerase [Nitrososphaera sp.]
MYDNSTPIDRQVSSSIGALIAAINKFPTEWALTPCIGKRNLWPQWQKTKLDRAQLIEAIQSQTNHEGKKTAWTGVSIVTGPMSGGVMAIDFDGRLAWKKYLELSGDQVPPLTKHWTSGKDGHFQILLSVPPEKWEGLKHQKIELDNNEKLELRWNQCSTLPPSIHPDTRKPYTWVTEEDVAECPDFILDLMREAPTIELPQKPKPENSTYIDTGDKNLVDILEQEILPRLDAEEFYGSYLKLKSSGKNLNGLCPFHQEKTPSFYITPSEKTFHCFGCGVGGRPVQFLHQIKGGSGSPTGKDFYSVVMELADRVGVSIPRQNLETQNPESKIQEPKPNNVLQHPATNVVRPPQFLVPPISELGEEVEKLLESDLKKSQLQL